LVFRSRLLSATLVLAVGAVNALRSSDRVNPRQVGLVGTSQVGWIIPRAAVDSQQGVRDSPPTDPQAPTTFLEWVRSKSA
jgi:hypothetical protein